MRDLNRQDHRLPPVEPSPLPTSEGFGTVLSLFCGAGGLDAGLESAGFRVGLAFDWDPVAVETYNHNRLPATPAQVCDLGTANPNDLLSAWDASVGVPPVGIVGGPPCQPFSLSNVHRVEDDPRARMPLVFAAITAAAVARYGAALRFFILENVAGLLTRPHRGLLEEFVTKFKVAGFDVIPPFLLDAQDFGVAQRRKRLFLVGFRSSTDRRRFKIPAGSPWTRVTVRDAIEGLPDPMPFSRGKRPVDQGLHPNHWHMNPRSEKFRNGKNAPGNHLGRSFRMLGWDEPSQTVAFGHREVAVHPTGVRRLSVLESMLLQGFPATYELTGTLTDQIRLVSDSVPPPLAAAIGSAVAASLLEPPLDDAYTQSGSSGQLAQDGRRGAQIIAPRSTRA